MYCTIDTVHVVQTPVRFPPAVGGVESYVHDISVELVDRGHDVTVVCADTTGGPADIDGIEVRRLMTPFAVANTDVTPQLPATLSRVARRADVIHTHLPTPWCADVSAAVGQVTDTPTVLTYHNDIVGDGCAAPVAALYNHLVLPVTLSFVDRILLTRAGYAESSPQLAPHHPTTVVRNGVDTDHFHPLTDETPPPGFDKDCPTAFFLSVLDGHHRYKGLETLLAALEHTDNPVHLVVGGDGEARTRYERFARERGVAEQTTFVGYVPEESLPAAYGAADIFVLPSTDRDREGFGLVLLEALACGTPVVTTPVVGVADAVCETGCGVVVTPGDPKRLAAGITALLDDDANAMGTAGRRLCVERYDWSDSVDQLVDSYWAVTQEG